MSRKPRRRSGLIKIEEALSSAYRENLPPGCPSEESQNPVTDDRPSRVRHLIVCQATPESVEPGLVYRAHTGDESL